MIRQWDRESGGTGRAAQIGEGAQSTAIGLPGEPVAPLIGNGA
jgi:hypothetical protein